MSVESNIRKTVANLQKKSNQATNRVAKMVPNLDLTPARRRKLITSLKRGKKAADKQFLKVLLKIAGRDAKLKALARR